MAEWLKAHAWNACIRFKAYRGFESLFLRHKGWLLKSTSLLNGECKLNTGFLPSNSLFENINFNNSLFLHFSKLQIIYKHSKEESKAIHRKLIDKAVGIIYALKGRDLRIVVKILEALDGEG